MISVADRETIRHPGGRAGTINLVLEPAVAERYRLLLYEPFLAAEGVVQRGGGVVAVRVESVRGMASSASEGP